MFLGSRGLRVFLEMFMFVMLLIFQWGYGGGGVIVGNFDGDYFGGLIYYYKFIGLNDDEILIGKSGMCFNVYYKISGVFRFFMDIW